MHTPEETNTMLRDFEAYAKRVHAELLSGTHAVDGRSIAIAKTNVETGILWMKSAVLQEQS
ncbi:hypothetical protein D3C85_1784550 [compost metagenome]